METDWQEESLSSDTLSLIRRGRGAVSRLLVIDRDLILFKRRGYPLQTSIGDANHHLIQALSQVVDAGIQVGFISHEKKPVVASEDWKLYKAHTSFLEDMLRIGRVRPDFWMASMTSSTPSHEVKARLVKRGSDILKIEPERMIYLGARPRDFDAVEEIGVHVLLYTGEGKWASSVSDGDGVTSASLSHTLNRFIVHQAV